MYAKIIDNVVLKYPYTYDNLKRDYPETSFPDLSNLNHDQIPDFSSFGYVYVHESAHPEYDQSTQRIKETTPEYKDGKWVEKWLVEDIPNYELEFILQNQLQQIKSHASELLLKSDYLDLPNTSSKISNLSEILAYRDALRAIAINPTIGVEFPIKPEVIWNL